MEEQDSRMLKIDKKKMYQILFWNLFPLLFILSTLLFGALFLFFFPIDSVSQGAYLGGFAGGFYAFIFGLYAGRIERNGQSTKDHKDELIYLERVSLTVVNEIRAAVKEVEKIQEQLRINEKTEPNHVFVTFNRILLITTIQFMTSKLLSIDVLNIAGTLSLHIQGTNRNIDSVNQMILELRSFGLTKPEHANVYKENIKSVNLILGEMKKEILRLEEQALTLQAASRLLLRLLPSDWFTSRVINFGVFGLESDDLNEEIKKAKAEYEMPGI